MPSPYYAIDRYGKHEIKRNCVIAPDGRVDNLRKRTFCLINFILLCIMYFYVCHYISIYISLLWGLMMRELTFILRDNLFPSTCRTCSRKMLPCHLQMLPNMLSISRNNSGISDYIYLMLK